MSIDKIQSILACEIECGVFEQHVLPALNVARHALSVDAQPVAWLVTGGKTFVDKPFLTEAHADKSIAERKDGARKVPLGRIDAALSQHTGEKDD
jgi:hypothetical protein